MDPARPGVGGVRPPWSDAGVTAAVVDPLFSLDGRIALITGSTRGIGRAMALGFAARGAAVVVTGRTAAVAESVAAEIATAGGRAIGVAAEVTAPDAAERLVAAAVDAFGGLDVVVNNAGLLRPHFVGKVTEGELDELYAINVKAPLLLARAAFPHLQRSGAAAVVNVCGVGAVHPMAGIGNYSATKAALLSWTRILAQEWASSGVRVNALVPGTVATDMILPSDEEARARHRAEMDHEVPLGFVADPEDMVGPAVFLASRASRYMTGHALVVDGGRLA
jgi:NAD(P)-dependent dehydrogenase (short-subunit alcohol dehydrogenase family)